jgi:hypothetical protein
LLNLTPTKKIKPCKIRTIIETLDKTDKDIFIKAIENRAFGARELAEALEQNKIYTSAAPIWRHRNGECSCSKI